MKNTQQSYLQLLLQNTNHCNTKTQLDSKTPRYIHCPERWPRDLKWSITVQSNTQNNFFCRTIQTVRNRNCIKTAHRQQISTRSVTDQQRHEPIFACNPHKHENYGILSSTCAKVRSKIRSPDQWHCWLQPLWKDNWTMRTNKDSMYSARVWIYYKARSRQINVNAWSYFTTNTW